MEGFGSEKADIAAGNAIVVDADPAAPWRGILRYRGLVVPCAVGRGGIVRRKTEGDGATPAGTWPLRRVLFRPDRLSTPRTGLRVDPIAENAGWCDAPEHPAYNQEIRHPFPASAERLWRADEVYDVIVVLGYNDAPVVPGAGSAIFFHIARPDFAPTAGCVAVSVPEMLQVLEDVTADTVMRVEPPA